MTKKRCVMFIGASAAGKTTLCQAIMHEELKYHKTQTLNVVGGFIIDTPGEYLERGRMRGALQVASAEAQLIVFMQSAAAQQSFFSPYLATMFTKPCIGVVTKADAATPEQIKAAVGHLERSGIKKIIITSAVTGSGVQELIDCLNSAGF